MHSPRTPSVRTAFFGALCAIVGAVPFPTSAEWRLPPAEYSYETVAGCPLRTKAFAACDDQMAIFTGAVETAVASNQLLFIVFGADWCPWCRSLDRLVPSAEVLGYEGDTLNYKDNFHFIRIATSVVDGRGRRLSVPSGEAVLAEVLTRAPGVVPQGIPFVAIVNPRSAKVYARDISDLEHNVGNTNGHSPEKIRAMLRQADTALR